MCNLYSITTNQAAIIALFRVVNRSDLPTCLAHGCPAFLRSSKNAPSKNIPETIAGSQATLSLY
jgi:hypothetical protein